MSAEYNRAKVEFAQTGLRYCPAGWPKAMPAALADG